MGAELFHVDRRTHMTELIVAFRKFTNAPKNEIFGGLETKTFMLKSKRCKELNLTDIKNFTTLLRFQQTTQGNGKSLIQKEHTAVN